MLKFPGISYSYEAPSLKAPTLSVELPVCEEIPPPIVKFTRCAWTATVPAAIAGLLLNDLAENTFRNPLMIAVCLMVFACLLGWADKKGRKNPDTPILFSTLMIIGCAQALALMPGVSRSGITITAALLLGLSRSTSARISFLLSTPIIGGATLLELRHLTPADFNMPLLWGFVSAFLGALLVIGWLMKYIKTHSFNVFVYYRLILGLVIIAFYFWK